jgi:hypothetical protein
MPTRGAVAAETFLCLREHLDGHPIILKTAIRKDVVTARNELAKLAREIDADGLPFEPTYVLSVDDDAWWPAGHVDRAVEILDANPDVTMVSGVFGKREANRGTTLMLDIEPTAVATDTLDMVKRYGYIPSRYQDGELTRLRYCGLHWVMFRRSVLDALGDSPFGQIQLVDRYLASQPHLEAEDFSFCWRLRQVGGVIVTERSLLVGHVETATGTVYFPFAAGRKSRGYSSLPSRATLHVVRFDATTFRIEPLCRRGTSSRVCSGHGPFRMKQRGRDYDMQSAPR